MAKELDVLLAESRAIGREREALRLKAKALWAEINPLLEEAERKRKANPTPGTEAQTVG